ncbi:MAG: hypothetical protein IT385_22045 [Deltaproteobacteria bacterium]|nr:hypothetical protein [Deltaproteobacteria bacterium]
MFTPIESSTGALDVRWDDDPTVATLEAWLLLVDPAGIDPDTLAREAFLRELIRVPIDARALRARVHVPVGRPLGLALVARDAAGLPLGPRAFTLDAPERSQPEAGSVASLERVVAERLAVPAPRVLGPTGFGMRQRRTLNRLAFPVDAGPAPRVAIVRATFIHEEDVRAWAEGPPDDAVPLPPDADGLVDAATPDDVMAFYVVLEASGEGAGPWRPLVLTPVPPPFDATARPCVIGDGPARAAALRASAPDSGPARELVDAALVALGGTPR